MRPLPGNLVQTRRSKNAAKAPKSKRMEASIEAVYENTLEREDLDGGEGQASQRSGLHGIR